MLASGAFLLCGLCQSVQAQIVASGTATLADVLGANSGAEALTVTYAVDLSSGVYTYTYSVFNPAGDVQLPGSASPGSPEVVDSFSVAFDTLVPGAFIGGSQSGGTSQQNNGVAGLFWSFTGVNPSNSSPTLSFESDDPPTMGNANASDANPPSPWASNPNGQQVPIPAISVPDSASTATLLTGVLMLVPFGSARLRRH